MMDFPETEQFLTSQTCLVSRPDEKSCRWELCATSPLSAELQHQFQDLISQEQNASESGMDYQWSPPEFNCAFQSTV
jgi:hypothetical protein